MQLRHDVVNWLSPFDFCSKQQDILSDRCPGTGEWFLKSQEFNDWLRGTNQTLWLDGIRKFLLHLPSNKIQEARRNSAAFN